MNCLIGVCRPRSKDIGGVNLKKLRNKTLTSTEFMQVWFHYDTDKNGFLEYVEFAQFMKDLFIKPKTSSITAKDVERYTKDMIKLTCTYDEDGDGKFEMAELAKVLKLERNFLENIIKQGIVSSKHVKSILSHYNSNDDNTIEGAELYAFVGDITRHFGLKLTLSKVDEFVADITRKLGRDTIDEEAIKVILSEDSIKELRESFVNKK